MSKKLSPRAHVLPLLLTVAVLHLWLIPHVHAQRTHKSSPAQARDAGALSAQEIARRTLPAVVLLVCDDGKSQTSQGSGFFVRPGVLVTNFHVVKGMERGTMRKAFGDGRAPRSWRIAAVMEFDEQADLALLNVPDAMVEAIPALPLVSRNEVEIGETIYALGNPEGLTGTISPGIVSAGLRSFEAGTRLQVSAPLSQGSSGGPVVNARGEVVGVSQSSLNEGQNLNFAVPAQLVRSLLARADARGEQLFAGNPNVEGAWGWPDNTAVATTETIKPAPVKPAPVQPPPSEMDSPKIPEAVTAPKPLAAVHPVGALRPGETETRASMRGLKGVKVVVESIHEDAKALLTERQLQDSIETQLKEKSIALLNEADWKNSPGAPTLYLNLSILKSSNGQYAYTITLQLIQNVLLDRDRSFSTRAATWDTSADGLAERDAIVSTINKSVDEAVKEFVNEFLAAQ